jgi:hypothetical protein
MKRAKVAPFEPRPTLVILELKTGSVPDQDPPSRRIALKVRSDFVQFCTWNGIDPDHAHANYRLAPGSVVSVGDDVPVEVIQGRFAGGWHTYRRVGDECLCLVNGKVDEKPRQYIQ